MVKNKGGEDDDVSNLFEEMPWIPNDEEIDARSHGGLVRRREGGGFSTSPPREWEGLDAGIFWIEGCSASLQVTS